MGYTGRSARVMENISKAGQQKMPAGQYNVSIIMSGSTNSTPQNSRRLITQLTPGNMCKQRILLNKFISFNVKCIEFVLQLLNYCIFTCPVGANTPEPQKPPNRSKNSPQKIFFCKQHFT